MSKREITPSKMVRQNKIWLSIW